MRTLLLAASALSVCALAACGRQATSTDAAAAAPTRQPAADTSTPPPRPVTEASDVTGVTRGDGGAYGMPRAPIPYENLGAYERLWDQQARDGAASSLQTGQPGRPPAPPRTRTTRPSRANTVFY